MTSSFSRLGALLAWRTRNQTQLQILAALALGAIFAAAGSAQPVAAALQNNYSFGLPGTPNYAIAQGSIFVLYGTNMAPAGLLLQGFDPELERDLGGVRIRVTVNGVTTEAIPYYVSPTQLAAILPSATPVGDGTLTVTYNGQTSAPLAIHVVQSAFGILTLSGNGLGTAAVYDTGFSFVTVTNSANPGQTVIFWGTGLGPDPNDETRLIAAPQNLGQFPFEFYIGGKLATVSYRGRSAFPGLDQLNIVIPTGVSGCFVSVYAKSGNLISNFVTIPVAASGRTCSDSTLGLDANDITRLFSGSTLRTGFLSLGRDINHSPGISIGPIMLPPTVTTSDTAIGSFVRYSPSTFANFGVQGQTSIGGCTVSTFSLSGGFIPPDIAFLDPGAITLTPPGGTPIAMTKMNDIYFHSATAPDDPLFIPDTGGTFRFNAAGGADIGAFEATLNASTPLVWSNREAIESVNRSASLQITWTGGQPSSYVSMSGTSSTQNPGIFTSFTCTSEVAPGQFVIPQAVLGSMVPSFSLGAGLPPSGSLSVDNYSFPGRFTAPGLDYGSIGFYSSTSQSLAYQ